MKTELYIIKNKNDYIRYTEGTYRLCQFDKASVFQVDQIDTVKDHLEKVKASGYDDACIKKLIIEEKDFE